MPTNRHVSRSERTQHVASVTVVANLVSLKTRPGRYVPPASRERVCKLVDSSSPLPLDQLTDREREVFELLLRGHTNDAIARLLHISPRTVETYRQRITRKLEASSLVALVRLAARLGILD